MRCSICNKQGHNSRTCPNKSMAVLRNQALWIKFDNLTENEASKLQSQIVKDKSKIAPKARGTAVKGSVSELPGRIRNSLRLGGSIK